LRIKMLARPAASANGRHGSMVLLVRHEHCISPLE